MDKIAGSGSGWGRVGVSKNTIGYFRVSFLLSGISGISGYVGYFWVFLGLPIYTSVINLRLLSSFRVMCWMGQMDGMVWDGYHRS